MKTLAARLISGFALVALLTVALLPNLAVAQDGDDDVAVVVERIRNAATNLSENADSYTVTSVNAQTLDLSLSIPLLGQSVSQSQSSASELVADVIADGDTLNAQGFVEYASSTVEMQNDEVTSESNILLDTELRLVEGTLYMNAEVIEGEGPGFFAPPEGWVVLAEDVNEDSEIADIALVAVPGLDEWNLDIVADVPSGAEDDEDLQDIIELFELASDITVETDTLDDGTEVDVIVVSVPGPALLESDSELFPLPTDQDETTANIFDAIFADLVMEFNFAIDGDEIWRGYYFTVSGSVATEDLASILGEGVLPEGVEGSIELSIEVDQAQVFTNLNEDFDAAAVPNDLAE